MKKYILLFLLISLLTACNTTVNNPKVISDYPTIFPDYINVTIPPTIAPMNFNVIDTDYSRINVTIHGENGKEIHVNNKKNTNFPINKWQELLKENIGDSLIVTVSVKQNNGWVEYKPFAFYISKHPIDYGLVYRKIAPGYEVYSKMGIYERDLSTFNEKPIIENTLVPGMCVNCHAFNQADPTNMSLHIRGSHGGTMLQEGANLQMLNTKTDSTLSACVYPYWHPNGDYIAYSVNETRQSFHAVENERIEVMDMASDIVIYQPKNHKILLTPELKRKDAFETFPAFSADGTKLYFCSADAKNIPHEYKDVKYSLCSIDFDPQTGTFGHKIDTLINAKEINKSISFPRPSYDGKYIMFTLSDYGNFSIWHKEADLWLLNVADNSIRPLNEVNSNDTESFHNWSSNSHWFVFSSRRDDGLYTKPYLALIDDNGKVSKPFLLPQKNPESYYSYSTFAFNVPDFVKTPMQSNLREMERVINSNERTPVSIRQ